MESAAWKFSITWSAAWDSSVTAVVLATNFTGGIYIESGDLNTYDNTNTLTSTRTVTASSSSVVTITVDPVAGEITVAGADTGNGTYSYDTTNPFFDASSQLDIGSSDGTTGGAYRLDLAGGTMSDIEDVVASAPVSVPVVAVTATPLALTASEVQPLSPGVIAVTATPLALTASEVQPVALPAVAVTVEALLVQLRVDLPVVAVTMDPQALVADEVQPVTLGDVAVTADPQALSASEVQPVALDVVAVTASPLAPELPWPVVLPAVSVAVVAKALSAGGRFNGLGINLAYLLSTQLGLADE